MPTRRIAITTALAMIAGPAFGAAPSPFASAIRRARLADAAHRQAGRDSLDVFGPHGPRPAYWRAYRFGVMAERYSARRALYALTPTTADEADALVAYYAERVTLTGNPETARAARRRLRKVFARSGVPDVLQFHPRKPSAPVSTTAVLEGSALRAEIEAAAQVALDQADRLIALLDRMEEAPASPAAETPAGQVVQLRATVAHTEVNAVEPTP
ncbi:UNVERIFIED_CONTAM: hypothetical protein Q9R58_25465 [Methylobacteriaceae bacterium AG10]|nr:hypothetical protein [Methylobacteriaceae bacterium AG10]